MRLFFGELATSNAVLGLDDSLREIWVLQSPKAEESWIELLIISDIDVEFSITCNHEISVRIIYVDTRDLSSSCNVAFKCEQWFQCYLTIFDFFLLFLLLNFLLLLLASQATKTTLLFAFFLFVIFFPFLELYVRVISISNMLLMELGLSQKTLNNFDCKHY